VNIRVEPLQGKSVQSQVPKNIMI